MTSFSAADMQFPIGEETRSYLRRKGGGTPAIGVEHVFMAAMEHLRDRYAGGGVLHYREYELETWSKLAILIRQSEQPWTPPDPTLGLPQQTSAQRSTEEKSEEQRLVTFGCNRPPGWQPPPDNLEYHQLIAAQHYAGLERGVNYATVYEVIYDCLKYDRLAKLLTEAGLSREEIKLRVEPFLNLVQAQEELEAIRWATVAAVLRSDVFNTTDSEPKVYFSVRDVPLLAMRLAQDTVTLPLIFLSGLHQTRTRIISSSSTSVLPELTSLCSAVENHITNGHPPSPYAFDKDPWGHGEIHGAVPLNKLKVRKEAVNLLKTHKEDANSQGEPFASLREVLRDLLGYDEIRKLLETVGVTLAEVKSSFEVPSISV